MCRELGRARRHPKSVASRIAREVQVKCPRAQIGININPLIVRDRPTIHLVSSFCSPLDASYTNRSLQNHALRLTSTRPPRQCTMKSLRRSLNNNNSATSPQTSPPITSSSASNPLARPSNKVAPPQKVIKALRSHRSTNPQELSYNEGDFWYVTGEREGWYEALSECRAVPLGSTAVGVPGKQMRRAGRRSCQTRWWAAEAWCRKTTLRSSRKGGGRRRRVVKRGRASRLGECTCCKRCVQREQYSLRSASSGKALADNSSHTPSYEQSRTPPAMTSPPASQSAARASAGGSARPPRQP